MTLFRLRLETCTETCSKHYIWPWCSEIHQRSDDCSICKWVCQLPLSNNTNPVIRLYWGIHRLWIFHLEPAQDFRYVFGLINKDPRWSLIHLQAEEKLHFSHRTHLELFMHYFFKFSAKKFVSRAKNNIIYINLNEKQVIPCFLGRQCVIDQASFESFG